MRKRELILALTVDDIRRSYTGSMLGLSWVLIKPLLLIGLYGVLFGIVFQSRGGPVQTSGEYLLLLLTGFLPWLIFSESLSSATGSITSNIGLVTKILFPIEILPFTKVLGSMLSGLAGLFLLVVVLATLHRIGWTLVLLPILLLAQVAFTIGLAWCLSAVNVAVRDTSQVLPLVLTVLMFLTPVVYTKEMVPEALAHLFSFNPMAYFIESYRAILLMNQIPPLKTGLIVIAGAGVSFLLGYWLFYKMRVIMVDLV